MVTKIEFGTQKNYNLPNYSGVQKYLTERGIINNNAEIYVHDNTDTQAIPTGNTYTKCTVINQNGSNNNCVADGENNQIIINKKGIYHVNSNVSFSSGTNNVVWIGACFLNGEEQDQIHFARKTSSAGDVGSAGFSGTINVTEVPCNLDLRFRHDNGASVDITVTYGSLNCRYIGG